MTGGLITGCGDDGDDGTGAAGTTTTTTSTSTTSTTSTTTSTSGSVCDAYCTAIMTNCTGANAQYADQLSCMGSCAAFPDGMPGDEAGNSQACRAYHADAAAGDPALHCGHAGPSGEGACGTYCEAYCSIILSACTGTNEVYADDAACSAACGGINDDVTYSAAVTGGDSLACRIYHASVAASSTDQAAIHCGHTAVMSATCN